MIFELNSSANAIAIAIARTSAKSCKWSIILERIRIASDTHHNYTTYRQ